MNARRRGLAARDQAVSGFSGSLMRLCDGVTALGVALVDDEGETVDYAGVLSPFEVRVMAAEWRLVHEVSPGGTERQQVALRGRSKSYVGVSLEGGYLLVMQLARGAFVVSERALAEAVRSISLEAGLPIPRRFSGPGQTWMRVEVKSADQSRRPTAIWSAGCWHELEIIGCFRDLSGRRPITGYRARLSECLELTLVREAFDRWYSDAPIE